MALEQHDGALLAWLLESGFTVYGINPKSSDRARDVFRPAGGKDDRTDAQVVSDLLRSNIGRFKPMHAQSDETLRLRALARLRTRVNAQKGVGLQRLRTLLAEWCPAYPQESDQLHLTREAISRMQHAGKQQLPDPEDRPVHGWRDAVAEEMLANSVKGWH